MMTVCLRHGAYGETLSCTGNLVCRWLVALPVIVFFKWQKRDPCSADRRMRMMAAWYWVILAFACSCDGKIHSRDANYHNRGAKYLSREAKEYRMGAYRPSRVAVSNPAVAKKRSAAVVWLRMPDTVDRRPTIRRTNSTLRHAESTTRHLLVEIGSASIAICTAIGAAAPKMMRGKGEKRTSF
jgi:hypothetical protein